MPNATKLYLLLIVKKKKKKTGLASKMVQWVKTLSMQAWQPEFHLQNLQKASCGSSHLQNSCSYGQKGVRRETCTDGPRTTSLDSIE